ncbi:hypothetical protein BDR07DRAFT_1487242 [Suillus spraguei]|nr:hypothetical protein BDR07DRAFT_1487242 [Suillus spraguei]
MVDILHFVELIPPRQSLQSTSEVDIPQFNAEDSMMDVDFDGAHFEDKGESLSEVEVYEGAGTCYAHQFLELPMIHWLQLSFHNAKELRSHGEMLPKGLS